MILDNLIWTPVYLIYSRTINAHSIVVYYCPLPFFVFSISLLSSSQGRLIVFTRAPIVRPLLIVSNLIHSFCVVCRTHTLLSGHRTIALRCISSVTCTPWYISSLNCCTRSVAYSLSNEISPLNCCTRHFISAYLLDPTCHGCVLFFPYLCLFYSIL